VKRQRLIPGRAFTLHREEQVRDHDPGKKPVTPYLQFQNTDGKRSKTLFHLPPAVKPVFIRSSPDALELVEFIRDPALEMLPAENDLSRQTGRNFLRIGFVQISENGRH
jgi:hypothetical protein